MKAYLGDGVYAEQDRGMIKLVAAHNVVYLEYEVYRELLRFAYNFGWGVPSTEHAARCAQRMADEAPPLDDEFFKNAVHTPPGGKLPGTEPEEVTYCNDRGDVTFKGPKA